jgi:hypothetical protein
MGTVTAILDRARGRFDVRFLGARHAAGNRPPVFVIVPPASFAAAA